MKYGVEAQDYLGAKGTPTHNPERKRNPQPNMNPELRVRANEIWVEAQDYLGA